MSVPKSVCDNCIRECQWRAPSGGLDPPVITCPRIISKPQTNADRIRAMSDEELYNWFWWMHKEMMFYTDSHLFVREWLEQEAVE